MQMACCWLHPYACLNSESDSLCVCVCVCACVRAGMQLGGTLRVTPRTVQPAASAGATLRVIMDMGKFQGVIAATTPTGCLSTSMRRLVDTVSSTSPHTRRPSSANHSTDAALQSVVMDVGAGGCLPGCSHGGPPSKTTINTRQRVVVGVYVTTRSRRPCYTNHLKRDVPHRMRLDVMVL